MKTIPPAHAQQQLTHVADRFDEWRQIRTTRAEPIPQHLWEQATDFSVVLFRPNFMLASEEHPMKAHKNQWLLTMPSPRAIPCGATHQGTHYGVWRADAFAMI